MNRRTLLLCLAALPMTADLHAAEDRLSAAYVLSLEEGRTR
jgi:hypothetical protein